MFLLLKLSYMRNQNQTQALLQELQRNKFQNILKTTHLLMSAIHLNYL